MNWNTDYGLAALLVLGVLLFYNNIRKDLPLRRNKVFSHLLIAVTAADILDIFSSFVEDHPDVFPFSLLYISVIAFYMAVVTIPVLFGLMVVSLTGQIGRIEKNTRIFIAACLIFTELCIITSPLTGFVFSYSTERGYMMNFGFHIINGIEAVVVLLSSVYIYMNRAVTTAIQRSAVYIYTVATFLTCILQVVQFAYYPIICSGFAFSVLILFISVQSHNSFRDQKTGIFAIEGLNELQKEYISEGECYSLLCLTFTDYKIVRDSYGDEIMKPFLREISGLLSREVCKKGVIPFYIHTGRFVLLKKGFYDFSAEKAAIDNAFLNPWKIGGTSFQFSPTYAYISSDIRISDLQEAGALIDSALKDAIRSGSFSFISVDEEMLFEIKHEDKIRKALDRAIENDELEVWFQPIWCPGADRISSAEALVRIEDGELGTIYPDEFISVAEANGSIVNLGRQVFRKICEFISTHDIRKMGIDYLEVNLSPIQCLDDHLADEFIEIRKSYGIDPGLINLEITETAASDSMIVLENMLKLSRDGFSFSLDDYGTGFSNLMNMLSLPLSIIKIDKSIVWSFFDQSFALNAAVGNATVAMTGGIERDNNILEDLIPMFQARGLKVVCEGVETHEMVRVLEEMGCDYMQGFFFSKPIPADDFLEYVKAKNRRA